MAKYKKISLGVKIVLSFFILGLLLVSILFILIIPDIKRKDYNSALLQTQKMVLLSTQQIKLVVDYFKRYGKSEANIHKINILNNIDKIKLKNSLDSNYTYLESDLENITKEYICSINLDNKIFKNPNVQLSFEPSKYNNNQWLRFSSFNKTSMCPSENYYLYKTDFNNKELYITCTSKFKNNSYDIEKEVKQIVQKGFDLTQDIHHGKVYLMWVRKDIKDINLTLDELNNENYKNYCISKISNIKQPITGELKVKDILKVANIELFRHKIEEKEALTWISTIFEDERQKFILVLSSFEEDFNNSIENSFFKIFVVSILALVISILVAFFIFKRWIKNIEKLSYTARNICNGNLSLRSNVKGDDDIGVLGVAFDSMLNKLEENIKNLDLKVEKRTKELSASLKEKEILLKEIHHRVKNNLALTINFIKLQKYKVNDKNTKEVLSEIEKRVYTMELLHRKLYESKDLNSIDFKKYVEELVYELKNTFELKKDIQLITNIQKVFINIEYAMPCGLIINEVVTNAFKYAFTNTINPFVKIEFKLKDNIATLLIEDNGVGLPKDFEITKAKSLGLRLVSSISTGQLLGKIEYKYNKGASFCISFKMDE
ncbi:hypothetical protein CRU99_08425 [Malaciobacter mytili]|uniref:sensor histidine kinase n=1 Tax=Malaciobacter mytili TaxID=603050 RepID=UPI00100BFA31|nr:histidine kinase dimerization/phosphoacceptor domain -containing protein [Malaciobacter mytili]RXI43264.1 hypothetical protein CRU99_08425 [Malaciobacter mytili]